MKFILKYFFRDFISPTTVASEENADRDSQKESSLNENCIAKPSFNNGFDRSKIPGQLSGSLLDIFYIELRVLEISNSQLQTPFIEFLAHYFKMWLF